MNKKIPMIIDTDPGIDDAIAIGFSIFDEKINVKLVTTVVGNVSIEKTTNNTLKLIKFWNKENDIEIAKGAGKPLINDSVDASNVHGDSGLDGFDFKSIGELKISKKHAIEKMREILIKSNEKILIMAIGPLTNIALLLSIYPEVKSKIKEIVIMGGSLTRGNKNVMGEFNITTDPEAAKMVFKSGLNITLVPLDIGWKALIFKENLDKIKLTNKTGNMFYQLLKRYRGGSIKTGLRLYDVCAIAYISKPEIFETQKTYIDVETSGELTRGTTIIDLKGYMNKENNINVCVDIEPQKFNEWFNDSLKKCI